MTDKVTILKVTQKMLRASRDNLLDMAGSYEALAKLNVEELYYQINDISCELTRKLEVLENER